MGENNKESQKGNDQKNALEWAVFGISLLLVAGVLGYWCYQAYVDESASPDLYVEKHFAPTDNSRNRFRVVVHNKGGQTAESVLVEVVLRQNGEKLEAAQLQLPYVPNASQREGWVIFNTDPAKADTVEARVMSYRNP